MGDGKKLKEHIDNKGTNVRKIAKETGISATTLYTIIQKDTNIRFDFALRLANALDIDVNEICSASPFSGAITEEEIYPTLPDGLNGALDSSRIKTYLKYSLYPLMHLFGKTVCQMWIICLLLFISWMMKPGKRLWKRYNLSCSIIRMRKEQNR